MVGRRNEARNRLGRALMLMILFLSCWCQALSFTTRPNRLRIMGGPLNHPSSCSYSRCVNRCCSGSTIAMRDASASYWFNVGDPVRVLDDVLKANVNLKGRCGVVRETWAKCDVDPTCCCAEQVDLGMAVRVEFAGSETSDADGGSFLHYFAEEELIQVKDEEQERDATKPSIVDCNDDRPFDGMTCKAFKIDQLKMGKQAKRIAAFEESSRPTYRE